MFDFFEFESDPVLDELCKEVAKKYGQKSETLFTDEYCTKQCEFFDICNAQHDSCIKHEVDEVLKTLSDRECRILKGRYGYDGKVRTQKDLAIEFNETITRIREYERKALRKLRHPSRAKILRSFLCSALSRDKNNFYARLFTDLFLYQKQLLDILQQKPPVVEKEDPWQPSEEITPSSNIESLELSIRSVNCLNRANIVTVEDILKYPSKDFYRIRNLGRKSLIEICKKLKKIGHSDKAAEIEAAYHSLHFQCLPPQQPDISSKIETLGLSDIARNPLRRAGIETIEDILNLSAQAWLRIPSLGNKGTLEIIEKLKEFGYVEEGWRPHN